MVPLFAFLYFVGQGPAAYPAPSANIVDDFRLAAEGPYGRAVIDIGILSVNADGHPWERVYLIPSSDPPVLYSAYANFDCAARTVVIEHLWSLDTGFRVTGEFTGADAIFPEQGAIGAQLVEFMCNGSQARLQRPYLGSDEKSAIRMADPRFR